MPSRNELLAKEAQQSTATATHAAATVTVNAPSNGANTNYVTGIALSASGTIAATVAATLTNIVGSGTFTIQLPAAATAPVVLHFGTHPLKVTPGSNTVLTLPDLGSGITGTATLLYYTGDV